MTETRYDTEEQAWEREKARIGLEMHDGWKQQKLANGFADHPLTIGQGVGNRRQCAECGKMEDRHHTDMIPWEDLPPEQQALNYSGGRIPFKIGYQAALDDMRNIVLRDRDRTP